MADIYSHGVRIHYEVDGEGVPLLLHHGFAVSLTGWRLSNYVEQLKDDYQVILLDARGHGASEKPHDPTAYSPEFMVGDILAVLDALDVPKVHLWGYSMGARIVRDVANTTPERVSSLILGGFGPAPEPMKEALQKGLDAFVEFLDQRMGGLRPEGRAIFMANDREALLACMARPIELTPALLPAMPCLVYAGEADETFLQAKGYAERLPRGRFFSLAGLGHIQAFVRSDLVLPRVKNFLSEVGVKAV